MCRLGIILFLASLLGPAASFAQVVVGGPAPTHVYSFDRDLSDSAGNIALQSLGGTVADGVFTFQANPGLLLVDPAINPATYTIEAWFKFDTVSGYRRILDFRNRTSDTGLYNLSGSLNFYGATTASVSDFVAGQLMHVVVTRLAETGEFAGYVNGQLRLAFTDSSSLATLSGPEKQLYFFTDDNAVGNEASSGSVDFIRLYDQALSSEQVLSLYNNGVPLAVPEPATWALLASGALLVGFVTRRKVGPALRASR